MLVFPPNVSGWPGGKAWIDSSTLMLRMRLPQLINDIDELNVKAKDDDDVMMGRMDEEGMGKGYARKSMIRAKVDWDTYVKNFESIPREELLSAVKKILLQSKSNTSDKLIQQYSDASGRANFIRSSTLQIMSTPEYQLS